MRIAKGVVLLLLVLPLPGAVIANAKQSAQLQPKGQGNQAYVRREVRHELMFVPWYSVFDIMKYSVNGNEVTLTGAVTDPTVKTDAENAVKHIDGVNKVNDQIEVLPLSKMDEQLRQMEYRAIYSQPQLSKYGVGALQAIHIIVKGGHVTLEGNVQSEADKDVASIAANHVPDVFSVTNNLVVESTK